MRAQVWSLFVIQLFRSMWPPDRSFWYLKEELSVLARITAKHHESMRWDYKKKGQGLNWGVMAAAMKNLEQWGSEPKWGRWTMPVLAFIPCWSEHAGNKSELMLEGFHPWSLCLKDSCKTAMREAPFTAGTAPMRMCHLQRFVNAQKRAKQKAVKLLYTHNSKSSSAFWPLQTSWVDGGTMLRYQHPRERVMLGPSCADYLPAQSVSFLLIFLLARIAGRIRQVNFLDSSCWS